MVIQCKTQDILKRIYYRHYNAPKHSLFCRATGICTYIQYIIHFLKHKERHLKHEHFNLVGINSFIQLNNFKFRGQKDLNTKQIMYRDNINK